MRFSLSVNHYICGDKMSFPDFAMAVRDAGIGYVGITQEALAELGLDLISKCLVDNDLRVSSLNSAGFFTGTSATKNYFSNTELIDIASKLKADVLCVITGGIGNPPMLLSEAYDKVKKGISELVNHAADKGVKLGIEPIYPADIISKGNINSIASALNLIEPYENIQLILDVKHSWWDPDFVPLIKNFPEKVALVQLCNICIKDGELKGRTNLASGSVDMSRLMKEIIKGKYCGNFEYELFPSDVGNRNPRDLISNFPKEFYGLIE